MKDAKGACHDESKASSMLPVQRFAQIPDGKHRKNGEGDDFLHGLELCGREMTMAEAIGGHLTAILEQGDAPADEDDGPQRCILELQMPIPRERHKDIGHQQQTNGGHRSGSCTCILRLIR